MNVDDFQRASLFLLVVDQGSLVGAARHKGLSPSVVSKRLAELERKLGIQLLKRTTRSMSLTEAGEQFYLRMRHLKGQWQGLLDETASLGKEVNGVITIAAPQPVLSRVLLEAVASFRQIYPKIEVVLQMAEYESLPRHEADLSFCRKLEKLDAATTVGVPLCDYVNSLFAAPSYLRSSSPPTKIEDLYEHDCLQYGLTTPNTWRFASGQSIEIDASLLSNNTEVIIQAAVAAQGIAYVPEMIIQQELRENKLQPVLPTLRSPKFRFWAYYQKLDYVPLKVRVFLDFLKAYF